MSTPQLDLFAAPAPARVVHGGDRHPVDGEVSARALYERYVARWGERAFAYSGGAR